MFKDLKKNAHIHMMGICGTAMGSLAGILKGMGYQVTGSDQNVYPPMSTQLEKLGIKIKEGYKKENLTPRPDAVIVGNVMSKKYEEVQALLETDIPYTSQAKAMGEIAIGDRKSIVISGTHGKTTTTAMMSWVATVCGVKPGFLIGGVPLNFETSFKIPEGDCFVIEGDEYDTAFFDKVPKFIHYKPKYVILTSIEFDHADIYKNLDEVKKAFSLLLELIPNDGILLYKHNDQNIKSILSHTKASKVLSYGRDSGADYQATDIKFTPEYSEFTVLYQGKKIDTVQVQVFGDYNIENAIADYALAREMGWPIDKIKEGLRTFKGVKRRQEVLGNFGGVTIIDDFAHHPTAVRLTVRAIQERFKEQRVISVFEPRSATSRRKIFQKEYTEAFQEAQYVLLSDVFNKGALGQEEELNPHLIVSELQKAGKKAELLSGPPAILERLKEIVRPGDVILIMSNGGFGSLHQGASAHFGTVAQQSVRKSE